MSLDTLFTAIGWLGSIFVVSAYGLSSFKKISSGSTLFHVLNLIGAVLLAASSIYTETYHFTFINSVWGCIAIISLWKIAVRKKEKASGT